MRLGLILLCTVPRGSRGGVYTESQQALRAGNDEEHNDEEHNEEDLDGDLDEDSGDGDCDDEDHDGDQHHSARAKDASLVSCGHSKNKFSLWAVCCMFAQRSCRFCMFLPFLPFLPEGVSLGMRGGGVGTRACTSASLYMYGYTAHLPVYTAAPVPHSTQRADEEQSIGSGAKERDPEDLKTSRTSRVARRERTM